MAVFLIPSLKLKQRSRSGQTVEEKIHRYLLERFGGYTAAAGNIFGYWKDDKGKESYGEHKEYKVALLDDKHMPQLKQFIARVCREIDEECIYLEAGKEAYFIYGKGQE